MFTSLFLIQVPRDFTQATLQSLYLNLREVLPEIILSGLGAERITSTLLGVAPNVSPSEAMAEMVFFQLFAQSLGHRLSWTVLLRDHVLGKQLETMFSSFTLDPTEPNSEGLGAASSVRNQRLSQVVASIPVSPSTQRFR
jgi:hypothetical protein